MLGVRVGLGGGFRFWDGVLVLVWGWLRVEKRLLYCWFLVVLGFGRGLSQVQGFFRVGLVWECGAGLGLVEAWLRFGGGFWVGLVVVGVGLASKSHDKSRTPQAKRWVLGGQWISFRSGLAGGPAPQRTHIKGTNGETVRLQTVLWQGCYWCCWGYCWWCYGCGKLVLLLARSCRQSRNRSCI